MAGRDTGERQRREREFLSPISYTSKVRKRSTDSDRVPLITAVLTAVCRMSWFFKSWRPAEKKDQARELRIATSENTASVCLSDTVDRSG